MERNWIEDIVYSGHATRRYTQDTPILPDVWVAFARDREKPQQLLLVAYQGRDEYHTTPGQLSLAVRSRLETERERVSTKSTSEQPALPIHVAYNNSTVRTELTFAEVVRVALPLSAWWWKKIGPTGFFEKSRNHQRLAEDGEFLELLARPSFAQTRRRPSAGITMRILRASTSAADLPRTGENLVVVAQARNALRIRIFDAEGKVFDRSYALAARRAEPVVELERLIGSLPDLEHLPGSQRDKVLEAVRKVIGAMPTLKWPDPGASPLSPNERTPDLNWLIRIIGAIALVRNSGDVPPPEWPPKNPADALSDRETSYFRRVAIAAFELLDGIDTTSSTREQNPESTLPQPEAAYIYSINLDRPATTTLVNSRVAIKADAAMKVFDLSCRQLTWAVVDCGIDARHPAFRARNRDGQAYSSPFASFTNQTRITATYDFTLIHYLLSPDAGSPASDEHRKRLEEIRARVERGRDARAEPADRQFSEQYRELQRSLQYGRAIDWKLLVPFIEVPHTAERYRAPTGTHGTHVAGIIGADWRIKDTEDDTYVAPEFDIRGVAPDINLYDIRVVDDRGLCDEFNVLAALQFLRDLKAQRDYMAFHGANLSLGFRQDVANFACGRTPVCEECERLVGAGIVVVASAGNDGYKRFLLEDCRVFETFHCVGISDPGNAEAVITVGSTHRTMPHTYGVSYFSSRGPTGDGRPKPDLVAPGEKITSLAPDGGVATLDGTSMAAPHVSGAVALLLAHHRELAGRPAAIKEILCKSATDLGRERHFQGAGLLDILRAIQSV